MKATGLVLIVIGIVLTVVTSFKFFTKEKVIDIGPLEVTADKPNYVNWSPILGIVIIVVGGVVLWQANKKQ